MSTLRATARVYNAWTITAIRPSDEPSWVLTDLTGGLVWMAKYRASDTDAAAVLTCELDDGITLDDTDPDGLTALVEVTDADWPETLTCPSTLHWGLMGRDAKGRRRLASGTLRVEQPIPDDAPEAS